MLKNEVHISNIVLNLTEEDDKWRVISHGVCRDNGDGDTLEEVV